MIRITSHMPFALCVPFPAPRGVEPEFFEIPAAADGQPGVAELENLDAITISRLRWHYDWRPTDVKNKGKKRDQLNADEIADIGLMTIEILDGKPAPARAPKKKKGQERRPTLADVAAEEGAAASS